MIKNKFRKEKRKKESINTTSLKSRCRSVDTPSILHRWSIDSPSFRWRSDGLMMKNHRRKINGSYINVRIWKLPESGILNETKVSKTKVIEGKLKKVSSFARKG